MLTTHTDVSVWITKDAKISVTRVTEDGTIALSVRQSGGGFGGTSLFFSSVGDDPLALLRNFRDTISQYLAQADPPKVIAGSVVATIGGDEPIGPALVVDAGQLQAIMDDSGLGSAGFAVSIPGPAPSGPQPAA